MEAVFHRCILNPNPLVKLGVTIALSVTILHPMNDRASWGAILLITVFLCINGCLSTGIKGLVGYAFVYVLPGLEFVSQLPVLLQIPIGIILMVRMFYLPLYAGTFFLKTSDVGSILSSLDVLKAPQEISIPIAVMFRYFPAFKEERRHVVRAMKIRGISMKNPLLYLECVTVPLLVISSNIADDIAKAAETKGIENPVVKTRYYKVGLGVVDAVFVGVSVALLIGGWVW